MSEPQPVIKRIRLRSDGPQRTVWEARYDGQDMLEIEARDVGAEDQNALGVVEEALTCARAVRLGSHLVPEFRSVLFDDGYGNHIVRLVLSMDGGQVLAAASESQCSEEEVLRFASSHAALLAALHRAGFSGFRPQLEDIVWRDSGREWTFYGWQEVRRDARSTVGDLSAAGRLWALLLLGHPAPTTPPLSLFADLDSWRRISLGTRRLLLQLLSPSRNDAPAVPASPGQASPSSCAVTSSMQFWQYSPIITADELVKALDDWQSYWERSKHSPDELLDAARGFDESQPQLAIDLRDLVGRQRPGSNGAEAVAIQASRAVLENVRKQAHDEYRRADFGSAALLFSRLAGTLTLPACERLDAWRWYAASSVLASEGADALSRIGGRTKPEILQKAIEVVNQDPEESAGTISQQAYKFSAGRTHLNELQADFRTVMLCRKANKEFILHPETAEQLYLDASQKLSGLPASYQDALIAVYGDPQSRVESCVRRRLQKEELDGHWQAAEAAEKAGDWGLAELRYRSAASLAGGLRIPQRSRECAEFDKQAREYESSANQMRLRTQVEHLPANATAEEIVQADHLPAFAALRSLLQNWPQNAWGEERLTAWRQQLQDGFTKVQPADWANMSLIGAALIALLPNDKDVRDLLSSRVADLAKAWMDDLEQIRKRPGSQTPADVEARIQDTQRHLDQLQQVRPWLAHVGRDGLFGELCQAAEAETERLRNRQHEQERIAAEYEDALEGCEPAHKVRAVLQKAQTLSVELYDDTIKTVKQLLVALPRSSWEAAHDAHIDLLMAEAHWKAGHPEEAKPLYKRVIENENAPKEYRDSALKAFQYLERAGDGASPTLAAARFGKPLVTLEQINKAVMWTRVWAIAGIALTAVLGGIVLGLTLLRGNGAPPPVAQATPAPPSPSSAAGIVWLRPDYWTGDVGVGQAVTATLEVTHTVDFTQPLQPIVDIWPEGSLEFALYSRPASADRYQWEIVITGTITGPAPALVVTSLPNGSRVAELEVMVRPTARTDEDRWLARTRDGEGRDILWVRGQSAVVVGRSRDRRAVKLRLADGSPGWIAASECLIAGDLDDVPEIGR